MFKQLPALVAVAGISLAIGANLSDTTSTTKEFTSELITAINNAETDVAFEWCAKEGRFGQYEYKENEKGEVLIDRVSVCTNKVDTADTALVWEILSHEATHVAQACKGVGVTGISAKELQSGVASRYDLDELRETYPESNWEAEMEAFYMEDAPKRDVIALVKEACAPASEASDEAND